MPGSTITTKGQAAIPKTVRDRLRLRPGDRVELIVEDDGRVVLVPATHRLADLYGALPPPRPVRFEAMESEVRAGAAGRSERET